MNNVSVNDRIEKLSSPGIKPGLSRVARLLKCLGNPQHTTKVIQIVGTNGKGTTAKTLYKILLESGYSVALYTSPHLVDFEERLLLDGQMSTPVLWHNALDKIENAISNDDVLRKFPPTFFEIATVAAILIMVSQNVDVAVVEAGMGGRFDATSILTNVVCSVICQIGIDHSHYLGNTLEEIAGEKMAIVRQGATAIYYGQEQLNSLFCDIVRRNKTNGVIFTKEATISDVQCSLSGTNFSLKINDGVANCYTTHLLGTFAVENVTFAIYIANFLKEIFSKITEQHIANAVSHVTWAGRFEIISRSPLIILDGGHNPHALKKVSTTLSQLCDNKITIIVAMMKDKDVSSALCHLKGINADFIATEVPGNPRSMKSSEMASCAKEVGLNAVGEFENPLDSIEFAVRQNKPIVILGSLFLVGYVKANQKQIENIVKNSI